MCGGKDKPCCTCALAGGCLTVMHEDNYCPATRKQVEKRLEWNMYPNDTNTMIEYISKMPVKKEYEQTYCCSSVKDGWILCSDRLPEACENVLAYIERDSWPEGYDRAVRKRCVEIAWQTHGRWHANGCTNVIGLAWMHLPEPPAGVRQT